MKPITKFLMVLIPIILLCIVIIIGVTEYNYTKDVNEKKAIISGFFYGMVYQEATHTLNQSIIYESNNSGIINCFNNQSENYSNVDLCLDYALQDMKREASS